MTIQDISFRLNIGGQQYFFPDYQNFTLSPLLNDMGGVSFTANLSAQNFGLLYDELAGERDVECSFFLDGVHLPQFDFYITDFDGDDITEGSVWTFTGVLPEYRLMDAVVAPRWNAAPVESGLPSVADGIYRNAGYDYYGQGDIMQVASEVRYHFTADDWTALPAPHPAQTAVDGTWDGYKLPDGGSNPPYIYGDPNDVGQAGAADTAELKFINSTAGFMMKFLMDEAVGRGCYTDITYDSWDAAGDSNGTPWPLQISISVTPGLTYLDFAKALVELQMADFQMFGKDLRLYIYGTLSTDRTTGNNPLIFRRGLDLVDSPRKLTVRDSATDVIVAGMEGFYSNQSDDSAQTNRGRKIEKFISQGTVSDQGTLDAYAEQQLALSTPATLEKTNGLSFAATVSKEPIADFNTGDWVYTDVGNGLERYRILQWTLTVDDKRQITGSVTLNDLIADREAQLVSAINGITNGTTIIGTSTASPVDPQQDLEPPAAPTGLAASSTPYQTQDGATLDAVSVSWSPVNTNENGTTALDIAGYNVNWQYTTPLTPGPNALPPVTDGTSTQFSGLAPYTVVQIGVQTFDASGNVSDWSYISITLLHDTTAPNTPSNPTCDNYLGIARARWDGLDLHGASMPSDFDHVEVHWSTAATFTPSAATLTDQLLGAGATFYDAGVYGTTYYCKFIAVDRSGNKSAATASSIGATPGQVVSADIFAGAVGSAQLANLAVTTAKINTLAVNDAQIGSVAAGKITAGTISAQLLISGRIGTAATGARCVLDATGLHLYNSSNALTFDANVSGSVMMVGTFRTILAANNSIVIDPGTARLQFWNTTGSDYGWVEAGTGGISLGYGGSNISPNVEIIPGSGLLFMAIPSLVSPSSWPSGRIQIVNVASGYGTASGSHIFFAPADADDTNESITIWSPRTTNFSPELRFVPNWIGGFRGGGNIAYFCTTSDGSGGHFQFVSDATLNPWVQLNALAFSVQSSESGKDHIRAYRDDPFDIIDQSPVFRYRNKGQVKTEHIGLVQERAHKELRYDNGDAKAIDLYQMSSVMWAAIQQMNERLKKVEA